MSENEIPAAVIFNSDVVIKDPNHPDAVQVPDEGKGSYDLPLQRLAQKSPNEVFGDGGTDEGVAELVDEDGDEVEVDEEDSNDDE